MIFTVNIFNEGLDFPDADTVLLLRPSMSYGLIFQQIGRALRKCPNKEKALILDFVGNHPSAYKIRQILSGDNYLFNGLTKKISYVYPLDCEVYFEEKIEEGINKQLTQIFMKDILRLTKEYFKTKRKINVKRIPFEEEILIFANKSLKDFLYHIGIQELWYLMGEDVRPKQIRRQLLISKFMGNTFTEIDKGLVVNYFDSWEKFEKFINNLKKNNLLRLENISINSLCPRCLERKAISYHHIIPRESGGEDNKENIICLCIRCHDEVEILTDNWIKKRGLVDPKILRSLIINLALGKD